MCVIDERKFRFTLWRKKCYKVLSKRWFDTEENEYSTPCQNTKVTVFKNGPTSLIPQNPSKNPFQIYNSDHYLFEEGFIFYFTDLETAKNYATWVDNGCVFEAYVPAFTRYAKDNDDPEGCAREIVLTKKVYGKF